MDVRDINIKIIPIEKDLTINILIIEEDRKGSILHKKEGFEIVDGIIRLEITPKDKKTFDEMINLSTHAFLKRIFN